MKARVRIETASSGHRVAIYDRLDVRSAERAILFFYGNGMTLAACGETVAGLEFIEAPFAIPDYVGYGLSSGKPSECSCYETAEIARRFVNRRGFADGRIVAMGWSMGAAVAIELATRCSVAAVVALSPFTSIGQVARFMVPWLPPPLINVTAAGKFDSQNRIPQVRAPLLLIHGMNDRMVPCEMTDRLVERVRSGRVVETLFIPRAGHNDLFEIGGAFMWRKIKEFTDKHCRLEV
jgi:fermentation-respiration switch protein FrsA (DUF1100 family)